MPISSVDANSPGYEQPVLRRTWVKWTVAALTLALSAGALIAWRSTSAKKEEKKPDEVKVFEFATADLARLTARELAQPIPVSGSVRPVLQAIVKSKVPGEVMRVNVRDGDTVVAGATLATLDTRDLQAQLDAANAAVAEARARLDLANKNETNNKQLLSKGFISQNAFDAVANSVSVITANVRAADAQASIARKALSDAVIRAPFAGVIAKRVVNIGEKVGADSPVVQLVDLSKLELEAMVPVSEIPNVKIGQEISFKVDGFVNREFTGQVERISPSAEAGSRAISVFVAIPNRDAALKGGMFATGLLTTSAKGKTNTLPSSAIQTEGGQSFVFIVKDGKIGRRPITTGNKNADLAVTEVREGIDATVDVVIVKAEDMKVGSIAKLKSAATPEKPSLATKG